MTILEEITNYKKKEVADKRELYPVKLLEKSIYYNTPPVSLKQYLTRPDKCGIIAEIKRKSPSRGIINNYVSVEKISIGYMQAGAAALSVLTDKNFFGGSNDDLITARNYNFCPILRKDFTIDEYQVIEAKSIGADVILLIAAALKPDEIRKLAKLARSLGMEVLLEIHNEKDLTANLIDEIDIVGINNRDLTNFNVSLETSIKLAEKIPGKYIKISESGISKPETILELRNYGFQGFLMGENFMKNSRPEKSCEEFINQVRELETQVAKS